MQEGDYLMKSLTKRQQDVLDFIHAEMDSRGRPPTQHQIKDHFGWTSTNAVRTHLRLLESKGAILFDKNQARGIRIPQRQNRREIREVAVLGQVAAGMPLEAIEDQDSTVGIDPDMFHGDDLFALVVKGDSMVNAGIFERDTVIVKRQVVANTGDIVVAMIDGEATVKRLVKKGRAVFFHPENEAYEDIVPRKGQDVSICGVVVGVIRKLG